MKKGTTESTKETRNNEVIGARADTAEVKKYKAKTKGNTGSTADPKKKSPRSGKNN